MNRLEALAGELYDHYCLAVGGVAYDGKPLPGWAEFSGDPTKQKQANGWRSVAEKAGQLCQLSGGCIL